MARNQADYDKGVALQKKLRGNVPSPPGRATMAELAPAMDELLTEVLFGRVWTRPELDLKLRSVATLATLVALQRLPQLKQHILYALNLGLTKEEIVEVITHVAWYAGVPTAVNAFQVAKEAFTAAGT
jgi:4-carboxymuconolactone decarboxylase